MRQRITFRDSGTGMMTKQITVQDGLTQRSIEIDLTKMSKSDLIFVARKLIEIATECLFRIGR